MHWFLSNVSLVAPEPYVQGFFLFSSQFLKSKMWLLIFHDFFTIFGSKHYKTLLLIRPETFQNLPEFLSQWSSQKYILFSYFKFREFHEFFFLFFFINTGPYESKTFKVLLLLQVSFKVIQTCFEFSIQWSSQKYCFGFWDLSFKFFFRNFKFIAPYRETQKFNSIILKRSDHRVKYSRIWYSEVLVKDIWDTFDLESFKDILGPFGALAIFLKMWFSKNATSYRYYLTTTLLYLYSLRGHAKVLFWSFKFFFWI